jgi:hypothetical protein
LVLNDGSTAKNNHTAMEYLSNSQTYNNAAEQTLSMTVTATGWSYSLNGAAATTGSFTFDTTKNYEFVGFIQGNNSDPDNVDGAYFSNITLTAWRLLLEHYPHSTGPPGFGRSVPERFRRDRHGPD